MTPAEAFTQASEAYLEALQAYRAGDLPSARAQSAALREAYEAYEASLRLPPTIGHV